MLKTIRNSSTKSLISVIQLKSAYSSGRDRRHRILSIRSEQKELYGRVIRGDNKQSNNKTTEAKPNNFNKNELESDGSKDVISSDLKPVTQDLANEFYWLVQRETNPNNIKIFKASQSKADENDEDIVEPSPKETS